MANSSKNLKIIFAPGNLGYIKSSVAQFPQYLVKKGLFKMLDSLDIQYEKEGTTEPDKVKPANFGNPKYKFSKQIAKFNQKLSRKSGGVNQKQK